MPVHVKAGLKNLTDAVARSFKPRLHHRHGSQLLLLLIISPANAHKERRLLCEDASGCFLRSINEAHVYCGGRFGDLKMTERVIRVRKQKVVCEINRTS